MAPLREPMIDEEQKKVLTSSDVLYSNENIGEQQKEKKVFTSSDVLNSSENVGEEQKKSSRLEMHCYFSGGL